MLLNEPEETGKWRITWEPFGWTSRIPTWTEVFIGSALFIAMPVLYVIVYDKVNKAEEKELAENGRYTIGYTTGQIYQNNSRYVFYYYFINGRRFETSGRTARSTYVNFENGRYYVKFSSKNPEIARILFHVPECRDSLVPPDGWAALPVEFDAK
ncbi:hypothetical protein [Chitinophaga rhizosphaerae]|uniref:hypothetical protein n=1 Tax=Chitinophaga rhizosphaerae TaxID=1864947 RepID=UPI000F80179D|nr:hypothetical protein [Chitinophaga rhizosphaerae]